ncbi:diguanylate cyclase [Vibrio sp. EA2]|uniref:diguanylate cyclase n=1 Tax=Vibrio sp. EA2 TaxID=3079860 RepID=UPI002948E301|nr:diguanylate cyclase [Vibrio sp. EA2]MDV6252214.1 diguanylate cyclase [Vibrio sp. EA2]
MRQFPNKQYYFVLFFLVFFALFVGVVELLHQNQREVNREQLLTEAKEQLSTLRSNLEADLMADIYQASTLGTLVTLLPESGERELGIAAHRILNKSKNIDAIGIAKDDVVNHIFPRDGNESVLGLDYRTVPEQWAQVQKAREIQEIFIAGPVTLVQGGRGLIVRVPVFRDPPLNQDYWGVISAVIDFDKLLKETGLIEFSHRYPLTIRGYDSSGESGDIFFGVPNLSKIRYATETVYFPYGSWSLSAFSSDKLEHQLPWYEFHLVRLLGYSALLALSITLIVIYRLYIIADTRALHDELTNLPNRRYFMQSYKQQFQLALRYKKRYNFALVNIDLDHFKHINDTYGHDAGDKVLRETAERVKSSLRRSDMVARMGGDEFLVVVYNPKSEESLQVLLQKVELALCSKPVIYGEDRIQLHVSMGYAMFEPGITSPEQMMKIADQRMYLHKHSKAQGVPAKLG